MQNISGSQNICGHVVYYCGFPGGSVVKNPSTNSGNTDSIPRSGRYLGEGNGNPFQLEWATVYEVTKESDTT